MRRYRFVPLLLSFQTLLPPGLSAQAPAARDLGWLAGCWTGQSGQTAYEEHWMAPGGGMLLGVSRTVAGDRAVSHEFLSIETRDGRLAYVARPSNQAETAFPLVRATSSKPVSGTVFEVAFENLQHDFPQRIIYRRNGTALHARVESGDGKKGQDFPMSAASCSDAAR
jgi:hypothetical protein